MWKSDINKKSSKSFLYSILHTKCDTRQDSTDGKVAASYLEDPGLNPVVGMTNMHHAAACLMQLWYIKYLHTRSEITDEQQLTDNDSADGGW